MTFLSSIQACPLPEDALLVKYSAAGAYTDCYVTDIEIPVSFSSYVTAFYTSRVFRLERLILKLAVSRPSSDTQAEQLAAGSIDTFAAWRVEARSGNQLLMCDFHGRTRSWLMVSSLENNGDTTTRLYFGSAIVPVKDPASGKMTLGFWFQALLGFHKLYSRVLLQATRKRLIAAASLT